MRAALAGHVDAELARRSTGALVYCVVVVVLALTTRYYSDHPGIIIWTGALTLVLGIARLLAARRLLSISSVSRSTRLSFRSTIYASFTLWGLFCCITLVLYGSEWTSMFLLLNTAALAAGASASLSPSFELACWCLSLEFLPVLATTLYLGGAKSLGLALVTTVYLLFLLGQAKRNWRQYRDSRLAAERERVRGSEQRRRAEVERGLLVAAIRQAAEEILITDSKGNIQYCNPAFEAGSGYTRAEVIGRNPRLLKSGKHEPAFYVSLWNRLLNEGVWSGRFINRRKNGLLYEVDATISAIRDSSGRLTGFVSARHDVTERNRLEAQLRQSQKMESIGRLAGGVAHDFNNLLTVIVGYSHVLESLLDAGHPGREHVRQIAAASARATELTQRLLVFSRKQIAVIRPLDLNRLIADTHPMLQRLVGEDVEVVVKAQDGLWLVQADAGQITQVLMNLAGNARDAMPRGGSLTIQTSNVQLDTPAGPDALNGPTVCVSIQDTGTGMDEEVQQHLFEPFFTTKPRGKGTGLGLATVYGIVHQSGGTIGLRTAPGRGSTFEIHLPRSAAEAPADQNELRGPKEVNGMETLLLVEDEDAVRHLMTHSLRAYGFQVLEAANGEEALRVAAGHDGRIHLLMADVIMPGMSGKDVADRLAPLRPDMKVLFVSGYSEDVISHRGVLDPGVEYLHKPFTPQKLAAKVREVLGPLT